MEDELDKKGTNFYGYLVWMQHEQKKGVALLQIDGILIVMLTQMAGVNIVVIHGQGIWYSDEVTRPHVVLVYKGSGEFAMTEKSKLLFLDLLIVMINAPSWFMLQITWTDRLILPNIFWIHIY